MSINYMTFHDCIIPGNMVDSSQIYAHLTWKGFCLLNEYQARTLFPVLIYKRNKFRFSCNFVFTFILYFK